MNPTELNFENPKLKIRRQIRISYFVYYNSNLMSLKHNGLIKLKTPRNRNIPGRSFGSHFSTITEDRPEKRETAGIWYKNSGGYRRSLEIKQRLPAFIGKTPAITAVS